MRRTTIMAWVCMAAAAAACGGSSGGAATTPTSPGDGGEELAGGGEEPEPTAEADGNMLPPDQLEAIQRALDRKRQSASRCLTDAIEAGELKKNARGKVTINFVIEPSGQARDVTVDERSLPSPLVRSCIVDMVGKIGFPTLPRAVDWSYTYAFEAF